MSWSGAILEIAIAVECDKFLVTASFDDTNKTGRISKRRIIDLLMNNSDIDLSSRHSYRCLERERTMFRVETQRRIDQITI